MTRKCTAFWFVTLCISESSEKLIASIFMFDEQGKKADDEADFFDPEEWGSLPFARRYNPENHTLHGRGNSSCCLRNQKMTQERGGRGQALSSEAPCKFNFVQQILFTQTLTMKLHYDVSVNSNYCSINGKIILRMGANMQREIPTSIQVSDYSYVKIFY